MSSKVFYMDGRSSSLQTGLVPKMLTVFEAAGLDKLIKPNDTVAIKLHCGEWNNSSYLRPVYARTLADKIKELGGRPFVCDTTTLPYAPYASRVSALDLQLTAERNGYSSAVLGCPFICADGYSGTDDFRVEIPEGYILKEAYIANAIASADVLIVLTHFKGHPQGVVGGAIKNLGIGAQSKRGKFNVHMGGHPQYGLGAMPFHPENYGGKKEDEDWQTLEGVCPYHLIHVTDDSVEWENEKCVNCLGCMRQMLSRGIIELQERWFESLNAAIADACLGTLKVVGKDKVGFINMAIDISPYCDCVPFSDMSIVPNLGVFAGTDPVALDKACIDKAAEAAGTTGSAAEDFEVAAPGTRKFEAVSPLLSGLCEELQINTGVKIGLGSMEYDLVEVPEKPGTDFAFPPDSRLTGIRYSGNFEKIPPFPYDRHNGHGFDRVENVDLDTLNKYQNSNGGE
jgi:uncharacterized protein